MSPVTSLIMSTTRSLTVAFVAQEAETLNAAGKTLCISRKVNDWYTVIWSSGKILPANVFSWTDGFQAFAIEAFDDGEKVAPKDTIGISKGQLLTFDAEGKMSVTDNSDNRSKDGILVQNNAPRPLWIGLSNILINPADPSPTPTPFWVGRYGMIKDSKSLLYPSSNVMVWLGDQTVQAGAMFMNALKVAEVDLSETPAKVVAYTLGKWLEGSPTGGALPSLDYKDGEIVPAADKPVELVPK